MTCELCKHEIPWGYDGIGRAKVMGLRNEDDEEPFPLYKDCFKSLELEIETTFLKKVMEEKGRRISSNEM